MTQIYVKTTMKTIPKTCQECTFHACSLPCKEVKGACEIRKAYRTKRHKDCPLVTIEN